MDPLLRCIVACAVDWYGFGSRKRTNAQFQTMSSMIKRHVVGDPVPQETSPGPTLPQPPVPPTIPATPPPQRKPQRARSMVAMLFVLCSMGQVLAQGTDTVMQDADLKPLPHKSYRLAALTLGPQDPLKLQEPRPWLHYSDTIADLLLLDMDQRNRYKELDAGYNAEVDRTDVQPADRLKYRRNLEEQVKEILNEEQYKKWNELRGTKPAEP